MADSNEKKDDLDVFKLAKDVAKDTYNKKIVPRAEQSAHKAVDGAIDIFADMIKDFFAGVFHSAPTTKTGSSDVNYVNYRNCSNGQLTQNQDSLEKTRRFYQSQFVAQLGPCKYGRVYAYVDDTTSYNNVMSVLSNKLNLFRMIKVSDLYEACNTPPEESANWAANYSRGWYTLDSVKYTRISGKYVFIMEEPTALN